MKNSIEVFLDRLNNKLPSAVTDITPLVCDELQTFNLYINRHVIKKDFDEMQFSETLNTSDIAFLKKGILWVLLNLEAQSKNIPVTEIMYSQLAQFYLGDSTEYAKLYSAPLNFLNNYLRTNKFFTLYSVNRESSLMFSPFGHVKTVDLTTMEKTATVSTSKDTITEIDKAMEDTDETALEENLEILKGFILFKNTRIIKQALNNSMDPKYHVVALLILLYLEAYLTDKQLSTIICTNLLKVYGHDLTYSACYSRFKANPLANVLIRVASGERFSPKGMILSSQVLENFKKENFEITWFDSRETIIKKINFKTFINTLKNIDDFKKIFNDFLANKPLQSMTLPPVGTHYKKRQSGAKEKLEKFILFKKMEEIKETLDKTVASDDHYLAILILLYLEAHLIKKSVSSDMCYVLLKKYETGLSIKKIRLLFNENPLNQLLKTENKGRKVLPKALSTEAINQLRNNNTDGITQIDLTGVINKLKNIEPDGAFAKFFASTDAHMTDCSVSLILMELHATPRLSAMRKRKSSEEELLTEIKKSRKDNEESNPTPLSEDEEKHSSDSFTI